MYLNQLDSQLVSKSLHISPPRVLPPLLPLLVLVPLLCIPIPHLRAHYQSPLNEKRVTLIPKSNSIFFILNYHFYSKLIYLYRIHTLEELKAGRAVCEPESAVREKVRENKEK